MPVCCKGKSENIQASLIVASASDMWATGGACATCMGVVGVMAGWPTSCVVGDDAVVRM